MTTSLYIHIPFCRRKCTYCDFYSVLYERTLAGDYVDVIASEIAAAGTGFSSIFIGGGTPTVLERPLLEKLLRGLERIVAAGRDIEFTVEANPESLDAEKIAVLIDHGVNRLSIGCQSFLDEKLKRLGRLHNAKRAEEAVITAARRGCANIGIDLIFGVWGEDAASWQKDLARAVSLPVTHVSCYGLTYEKGTPLFAALEQRSVTPLPDEDVAALYEQAIDHLALSGIKQYEISNFAKAGYECRHNLHYWENTPYRGLGASAASYTENGTRTKNVSSVADYLSRYHAGRSPVDSRETLPPLRRAKETAAIKIRTKEGILFDWFRKTTGFDFQELEKRVLGDLCEKDLIRYIRTADAVTGVCLKRKGFLFADTVSSALL